MKQLEYMIAIPKQVMACLGIENLAKPKDLGELVFNILSQRGEPSINNALLVVGIRIRLHDCSQCRKNTIPICSRVNGVPISVVERLW